MYKLRQTALNTYETCPQLFKIEWGGFGEPELYEDDNRPTNKYAMTGIALHKTMEYWGNERIAGRQPALLNLHDDLDVNFNEIPIVLFKDPSDREEFYNSVHEQLEWLLEHYGETVPISAELNFDLEDLIPGLPPFTGTVDRLEGSIANQDVDLLDYKSGKVFTRAEFKDNMQAGIYALAFKKMYGFFPKKFIFLFSKFKIAKTINITPDFIEASTTRIKSNWYHILNRDFNPPYKPNKFFCDNFCAQKKQCPKYKRPKGWEL